MKKIPARFVLATAATFVLVLSCYGLARAYLYYEAARAERMLKELAAVKIGDSEAQVLPMLERYGSCRGVLEPYTKVDKTDYECLVEIGPSGIYYVVNRANTSMFYRMTRAVLDSLNPRLRRAIGLRRWNVYGRVGFKDDKAKVVFGAVMVEGRHEWFEGDWSLVETIPEFEIDSFVTSPDVSWPHNANHYLVGWGSLIAMEIKNGGGFGASSWITPSASDEEKRSAHGFQWNCLTSRSGCRTVCASRTCSQTLTSLFHIMHFARLFPGPRSRLP
ncbi:MAG TPA: hypothetical protein VIH75_20740 [Candidatus Sulfotelmatobacter sp.]|jgi:hypothetical protein